MGAPAKESAKPTAESEKPTAESEKSAEAVASEESQKKRKATQPQGSNSDFIVDHILKKCTDMKSAEKFFTWLRRQLPGYRIKGRELSASDVDEAERRCQTVWKKKSTE